MKLNIILIFFILKIVRITTINHGWNKNGLRELRKPKREQEWVEGAEET